MTIRREVTSLVVHNEGGARRDLNSVRGEANFTLQRRLDGHEVLNLDNKVRICQCVKGCLR